MRRVQFSIISYFGFSSALSHLPVRRPIIQLGLVSTYRRACEEHSSSSRQWVLYTCRGRSICLYHSCQSYRWGAV